jgi:hypothetical protein
MADSDPDEDGSAEVSCQEQQNSEGDDDVEEVEASGSRPSAKPAGDRDRSPVASPVHLNVEDRETSAPGYVIS